MKNISILIFIFVVFVSSIYQINADYNKYLNNLRQEYNSSLLTIKTSELEKLKIYLEKFFNEKNISEKRIDFYKAFISLINEILVYKNLENTNNTNDPIISFCNGNEIKKDVTFPSGINSVKYDIKADTGDEFSYKINTSGIKNFLQIAATQHIGESAHKLITLSKSPCDFDISNKKRGVNWDNFSEGSIDLKASDLEIGSDYYLNLKFYNNWTKENSCTNGMNCSYRIEFKKQ